MPQSNSLESPALSVKQLSLSIGQKLVTDNISFVIPQSKKIALVGLNGAGKSSLIKLLVGELKSPQGEILFACDELTNMHPTELEFKKHLGYQASAMQALDNLTSREYLHLCCALKGCETSQVKQQIEQVIKLWHLFEIIDRPMQQLSQGNLQKLVIAQAFLAEPDFIFLDEPTQALDPIEQQRFIDNLGCLNNKICLFSSHHISETVEAANLVLMLHYGKLIALLDLDASDEYWLVTELKVEEIKGLLKPNVSVALSYQKKSQLICLRGLTQDDWLSLIKILTQQDPHLNILGNPAQSLMPLFALLANESL